jgi:hypothetical protein
MKRMHNQCNSTCQQRLKELNVIDATRNAEVSACDTSHWAGAGCAQVRQELLQTAAEYARLDRNSFAASRLPYDGPRDSDFSLFNSMGRAQYEMRETYELANAVLGVDTTTQLSTIPGTLWEGVKQLAAMYGTFFTLPVDGVRKLDFDQYVSDVERFQNEYLIPMGNQVIDSRFGIRMSATQMEALASAYETGNAAAVAEITGGRILDGAGLAATLVAPALKGATVLKGTTTAGKLAPVAEATRGAGAARAEAAELGAKLGNDSAILNATKWLKAEQGYYDVVVHGNPNVVGVRAGDQWLLMDHRSLATYIQKQADYGGSAVRLASCQTGACDIGFAQNLANKLGVPVKAPTDKLYVFPSGSTVIGPNQFTNTGGWRIFVPTKP